MAIEPLSSAMTFQAQPIQNAQTVRSAQPAEKPAEDFTESSVKETQRPVDNKTVVVDGAQEKGEGGQHSEQPNQQPSMDKVKKAVEDLNKRMSNSEALFGIHEETNRVTIKIVDKSTKEVIKELPPEKTLDMIAKVWEIAGLMVDEKR